MPLSLDYLQGRMWLVAAGMLLVAAMVAFDEVPGWARLPLVVSGALLALFPLTRTVLLWATERDNRAARNRVSR